MAIRYEQEVIFGPFHSFLRALQDRSKIWNEKMRFLTLPWDFCFNFNDESTHKILSKAIPLRFNLLQRDH